MSKQIELLKKLKALAERGIGGEANNAKAAMDKIMLKYNISLSDLEVVEIKPFFFKATGINNRLLHQIAKSLDYTIEVFDIKHEYRREYQADVFIKCTHAQFIEIEYKYEVYKKLYKKESEVFFRAFCKANDLLANPPELRSYDDLTEEEQKAYDKAAIMAKGIDKASIYKQISA